MSVAPSPGARSAMRTATNGTTEHVGFSGDDGARVYSWLYLPVSAAPASVVICSPLHGEFMRNYRREVLLARRLADLGFAVARFHYRFTGNSDGDGAHLTFGSMREDALDAVDRVRSASGAEELFLLGTRWGGLIAASAAADHPSASLVLWAPIVDASGFFKDAFRSSLIRDRKDGAERPLGRAELEAQLRSGRRVDAVASTIEPAFFRSAADRRLEAELGDAPRSILLMQIGPTGTVRPELARQAQHWRDAGSTVDIETIKGEESWWLIDDRWHEESKRPMTEQLISGTETWITQRVRGRGSR